MILKVETKRRIKIGFFSTLFCLGAIAVSMPNFVSCQDEHPEWFVVKANAHAFQTMLETYAIDWGGLYPANLKEVRIEALHEQYWKEMKNPYEDAYLTPYSSVLVESDTFDFAANRFRLDPPQPDKGGWKYLTLSKDKRSSKFKGLVIYDPVKNPDGTVTSYAIYATDKKGGLILYDGQKPFILSNS